MKRHGLAATLKRGWGELGVALAFAAAPLLIYAAIAREPTNPAREIAAGVTYAVEELTPDAHGRGRVFLARVKLDPAEVELFVTPPDPGATSDAGWTHRLESVAQAARERGLAVAINCSGFAGGSFPIHRSGERARAIETTVVEGRVVSWWEHTYLLGFLPDLTPEPWRNKPPPPAERLAGYTWAVGAQSWHAMEGRFHAGAGEGPVDARTVVGVNVETRELFLAVFDHASQGRAARELLARGASWAMHLDGGDSTAMAVNGRMVYGGWRPVANVLGVRARVKK